MTYSQPRGLLAGFSAILPDPALPELLHAGEQWAPRAFPIDAHSHVGWELYLQLDGWSTWEDGNGATYRVEGGGLLVMPPGLVHRLAGNIGTGADPSISGKHHFFFAEIAIETVLNRLPQLRSQWKSSTGRHVINAMALEAPFRQLVRELSMERTYRTDALRIAVDSLVLESTRLLGAEQVAIPHVMMHPAVMRAKELIEHQSARAWPLADLGRMTGVSPNHLSVLFTRDVGVPVRRYHLRVRIARAEAMLRETDISVSQLAHELGFSSSQHFATVFKQIVGLTPSECRSCETA